MAPVSRPALGAAGAITRFPQGYPHPVDTGELPPLLRDLIARLPAEDAPFPPAARTRWLTALSAAVELLWADDAEAAPPVFGALDQDGHLADVSGHELWRLAVWLPHGREPEVLAFLAGHGLDVYRMWPSGTPEPPGG